MAPYKHISHPISFKYVPCRQSYNASFIGFLHCRFVYRSSCLSPGAFSTKLANCIMDGNTTIVLDDQDMSSMRISNLEATIKYLANIQAKKQDSHQLEIASLKEQINGEIKLFISTRFISFDLFQHFIALFGLLRNVIYNFKS